MTHVPVRRRALSVALYLLTPAVALLLLIPTTSILLLTSAVTPAPPLGVQEALAQSLVDQNAVAQFQTTSTTPAPAEGTALAEDEQVVEPTPESTPGSVQVPALKPQTADDNPELFATPPRSLHLSIGHGRRADGRLDTGTVHPRTGEREIDAAAVVVQAMTEVLQQAPNLTLWAQSGNHPDVVGTVRAANQRRADDCIEIHQDWSRAPAGVFAHWHPSSGGAKQLADRLVVSLGGEGNPVRNDWHKARPGLWFLRGTTCRAVLVEVGRVGDFSNEQLAQFGRAMAHAYLDELRSHPGQGSAGAQQGKDGLGNRGAKNRTDDREEREGRGPADEAGSP